MISGRVTDAAGGPIHAAEVWACPFAGGPCSRNWSDADGYYTIGGLVAGDYRVQACAPDYVCQYYDDAGDEAAATPVPVTEGATTPNVNFGLRVAGAISGTVTDPGGNPIEGAAIWVSPYIGSGTYGYATTGPAGSYTIGGLATGDYRVEACATGYTCEYYEDATDWYAATPVPVTEGADTPNVNFGLRLGGTISGTVTDPGGNPIDGASVSATPYTGGGTSGYAIAGPDGSYAIGGLATNDYRVRACATGYICEYFEDASDWDAASPVPVTEGATTTNVNFGLRVAGAISGTVTDPGGNPIEGASVWAWPYDSGETSGSAVSGPDGSYAIGGLATNDYRVQACATGYICEFYEDAADWYAATPVPVTEGADTPNIDFSLHLGGTISGTVTDASGNPIEGAAVWVSPYIGSGTHGFAASGSDGSYTVVGLATGDYRVEACATGYICEYYEDATDWYAATPVPVTEGADTPNIHFSLHLGGTISGTVTDPGGNPIEGASVSASPYVGSGTSGYAVTGPDGSYAVGSLATGDYRVQACATGYACQYYDGATDWSAATPVPVTEGAGTFNIDFGLSAPGRISGTVTGVSGNPIEGASLFVSLYGGDATAGSTITAAGGTYTVDGLAPGDYRVQACGLGYVCEYYAGTPASEDADPVTVTAGGNTPKIDFSLDGADADGDGCTDIEEQNLGTGFDYTTWWDFADVPVPANPDPTPNGSREKVINMGDVLAVLFYFGADDDSSPNGNGVDYDSDKDADTVEDGLDYDRTASADPNPPWEAGPPDGAINTGDVLAVLAQVGLDCSGPP